MILLAATPEDFWGIILVLGAFVVFVFGIIILWVAMHRCSKCKRWQAMETTGAVRGRSFFIFWRSTEEWKCKYCGHRAWKKWSNCGTGNG